MHVLTVHSFPDATGVAFCTDGLGPSSLLADIFIIVFIIIFYYYQCIIINYQTSTA